MKPRPPVCVPRPVLALLGGALLAHLVVRAAAGPPAAEVRALRHPPASVALQAAAAGDPAALARGLMLWLQAFDHQGGISVPFERLDYDALVAWLDRILHLDPGSGYPLRAAVQVYANARSAQKRRTILDFVHEKFLEDPDRRWRWLALAAIHARHRLGDEARALRYARAITEHATGPGVPAWARDMSVALLEDGGEHRAAAEVAQRLLESGRVSAPHEVRYLAEKLLRPSHRSRARRARSGRNRTPHVETGAPLPNTEESNHEA